MTPASGIAARANAERPDPAGYERTLTNTRQYLKSADAIVEFGCGTGSTALQLAASVAQAPCRGMPPITGPRFEAAKSEKTGRRHSAPSGIFELRGVRWPKWCGLAAREAF